MKSVSKKQFANSIFWKACNFIFARGLTIIISIILARLLDPSHFGLMAIWSVLLSFCNVIVTGGVDTVLVQTNDLKEEDWSTALIACLCRAAVLFILSFIAAPYIAKFYDMPLLDGLIKIAGIDFFCQAIISVVTANKMRKMEFKKMFFADVLATVSGGCVAIYIYYLGGTGWVLIANTIFHRVAYSLLLCLFDRFSIHFVFNANSYKSLFKKGSKVMSNGLIDLCTSSIRTLFIAKKWISTDIGYLERAEKYTQIVGVESYNIISDLLLPTFSSYQNDKEKLKMIGRKIISSSCYIMFPLMLGLAICSKEIVILLLTDKWIESVPLMQIICIYYAVNPLRQACTKINYAVGKYKINVIIEGVRMVLTFASLIMIWFIKSPNIQVMCIATSFIMVITATLYLVSIRDAIQYSFIELVKDIGPTAVLVCIAMIPVYFLKMINLPLIIYLVVAVIAAGIVYLSLSAIFRVDVFCYIFSSIMAVIKNRKREADKDENKNSSRV